MSSEEAPFHITPTVITARAGWRVNHIFVVPYRQGRRPVKQLDDEGGLSWVCADGRREVLALSANLQREVALQRKAGGVLVYDEEDAQADLAERLPVALFAAQNGRMPWHSILKS